LRWTLDPGIVDRTTRGGPPLLKAASFFVVEGNQSEMPCIYFSHHVGYCYYWWWWRRRKGREWEWNMGVIKRSRKTMLFRWWSGELHHSHWGSIIFLLLRKIDMNRSKS
jgi:hypothetical protein